MGVREGGKVGEWEREKVGNRSAVTELKVVIGRMRENPSKCVEFTLPLKLLSHISPQSNAGISDAELMDCETGAKALCRGPHIGRAPSRNLNYPDN